ncbi:hypothetical protein [Flavobacterium sp. ACN6]|uniref:hypothetical protein n=1 Tax=Flavobacterium sp. ACN6 TaxID=1920426 RepID=UPI000BB31014|nr:hypothetical protein [Flavobacterium sp. ACN6]PBJ07281.1 hypothetical protein BSF42_38210 [Flavobacterium sp. ACN6]
MANNSKEYIYNINADATTINSFATNSCFDDTYIESDTSPIDNCLSKINQLNLIHTQYSALAPNPANIPTTYNLVLLGYISAIESYIREIIRKIILIDKISRISCELEEINYGAAISYPKSLLPEVILEKASFANKDNIINSFKKYLGLKGYQPNELIKTLEEFEKICHLRHCIVHRFGKLGSQNAIKFGLDNHSNLIEKPLKLDTGMVYNLSIICTNTVLVINKYLYSRILERTASKENNIWAWDLRSDKSKFEVYYKLFMSTEMPHTDTSLRNAYDKLKAYHNSL